MSLDVNDVVRLVKSILPGLILLIFVIGLALRLAIKPTMDAILRLREASQADHQTQQRIARLEDEVTRLRAGDSPIPPALDDGSRSKNPIRLE
jgi:hypothetical protein